MCSATVLQLKGQSLLFDAAEGVLRQIGLSRVALSLVTKIFITHLHGDHIFGLPSLLLSLQMASLYREQQGGSELNIHIYGPPGLCNYISMVITFSMAQSISGNIVVHELVGGDADPGPSRQSKEKQKGQSKDPKHRFYREFSRINISRRTIERNDDGTWTLETPSAANASVSISAAEVPHIEGVITFGYVVNEEEVPRTIDPIKATEQGVQPGPKYRLLKQGVSVLSDDETRMVDPESVYAEESKRKSRKFALIGDNCGLSPAMYKLSQDCDVLVHEATLIGEAADDYMIRGHASPEMAGRVARDVNAKVLVLNHISAKVHGSEEPSHDLVKLAQTTNQGASEIIVAHDFMELYVPFKGFDFEPLESAGLEKL
jgi:ribonuclease Z